MKRKGDKDLILFILIIPLFLFLAFYFSKGMEKNLPSYSIENKFKMGYSVFYEALKELNYPVERTLKQVAQHKTNSIQVITSGGNFNINNQDVKQWVEKGGTLIYLTPEISDYIEYGTLVDTKGNMEVYKYDKGSIIYADADFMANKTLAKDTNSAYELLKEISNLHYERLYFNESYLFSSVSSKSLWDTIPVGVKFIIYQMLVALGGFFYYKGKRFGKTRPLYEEVERSENEYLYSAASLYRQAKCLDLIIDNYYKNFLKRFKGKEEHWLEYWEIEKFPSLHQAKEVYEFMNYREGKPKVKEFIRIITMIEHLDKILDKRRDSQWKTMKKTLHENL
jgi:hypothetical protein